MPTKDRLNEYLARNDRVRGSKKGFPWHAHSRLRSESEGQLPDLPVIKGQKEIRVPVTAGQTENFLNKVDRVTSCINRLEKELSALKKLQSETLSSPLSSGQNDEIYRMLNTFRTTALDIRRQLKELDDEIAATKHQGTTEARICLVQRNALNENVSRVLSEFAKAETDYRQRCIHRVQRQLFIVGQPAVSQEHVEELLSRNEPTMLFTQGVIADSQRAKETLADIETRHGELLALEKSVTELRDLFKDLAILVETQGETVVSIESSVQMAKTGAADAGGLLKEARAMRKSVRSKKRKLMCFGGIALGIIATIIVLGVYFGT